MLKMFFDDYRLAEVLILFRGGAAIWTKKVQSPSAFSVGHRLLPGQVSPLSVRSL